MCLPVCHQGETDVKRVYSTLGAEQEFFLVDRGFYLLRPDLIATGRTLIGTPGPDQGVRVATVF